MDDKLQPIGRLYAEAPEPGSPGDKGMPPEGEAELRMLAPIKRALDELPRSRPDPTALANIQAAAGAHAVRHLYQESPPVLSDAAGVEARALEPVVTALDALPSQRPDAAVLAAVLAAASVPTPRGDRLAAAPPRQARRRRPAVLLGGLFVLFLIASTLVWIAQDTERAQVTADAGDTAVRSPDPSIPGKAESVERAPEALAEAPASAESTAPSATPSASVPVAAARSAPSAAPVTAAPSPEVLAASALTPDLAAADAETDGTALKLLYLRLEALQDDDLNWDGPAEVLGEPRSVPTSRSSGHGWMQVRVDR